jgi:putative Mg2+ transporter-C (MgtC) family protein
VGWTLRKIRRNVADAKNSELGPKDGPGTMSIDAAIGAPPQVTTQVSDLVVAIALTAVIGLERELRDKDAGLRTHAVIGLGAALFVQLSKYGFADVLSQQRVVLDPSRVAAQIASGIGFVGAGVIFVRRDGVKGLTTAASVWLSAAIGAAAGAGLLTAAVIATSGYVLITSGFTWASHRVSRWRTHTHDLLVSHQPGSGVLHRVLETCEASGYEPISTIASQTVGPDGEREAEAHIRLVGPEPLATVLALIRDVPGVHAVTMAGRQELGQASTVSTASKTDTSVRGGVKGKD